MRVSMGEPVCRVGIAAAVARAGFHSTAGGEAKIGLFASTSTKRGSESPFSERAGLGLAGAAIFESVRTEGEGAMWVDEGEGDRGGDATGGAGRGAAGVAAVWAAAALPI